jgi:hypothetical protein
MAKRIRKRKCRCCGIFFPPDRRNRRHQRFCSRPECRRAAKAASQKLWRKKPENRDYFCGPGNVHRVQEWRKANPGYSRPKTNTALQDYLAEKTSKNPKVNPSFASTALQDLLVSQPTVLIGLIAHLTGSALQDEIALTTRGLQQLGNDILNAPIQAKGDTHGEKASHLPAAHAANTQPVQLGGPPSGS